MSFRPSDFPRMLKKIWGKIRDIIDRMRESGVFRKAELTRRIIWNVFLIFTIILLVGAFFAFGAGAGYFAALVKDEPVVSYKSLKNDITDYTETSNMYFKDDVYLGEVPASLKRKKVALDDVSDKFKKALVATEDRYFYQHKGVVPKAVLRSLYQKASRAQNVSGGSTLTQQLVKNQILTPEVSFKRKAKEILYAMRIERFFNKSQILAAYLNVVPFGRNASGDNIAGIQAAAHGVFGVDADQLNVAQAAYLAGMPKNPFTYSPYTNSGEIKKDLSAGLKRMDTVLNRMKTNDMITDQQYKKAKNYHIKKHLRTHHKSASQKYPSLTIEIKKRAKSIIAKQIADKHGDDGEKLAKESHQYDQYRYEQKHHGIGTINPDFEDDAKQLKKSSEQYHRYLDIADKQIERNGYQIHTTIDKKLYNRLQKVTRNYKNYGPKKPFCPGGKCDKDNDGHRKEYIQQLASMLIKNDTGAILAYIPGRNHKALQYNLATQAYRSNGSTMKPLAVYAPAMEMGLVQPGSTVADLPYKVGSKKLSNFGKNYHGPESIRKALYKSHNIPAVKTYKREMKHGDPREYLQKMGVTSLVGSDHPTLGIGALTHGITVEENTNAFTTFANKGKFVDAHMIDKIVNKHGNTVYEHKPKPKRVFSKQTNYLMLDMMHDVLHKGTASGLPSRLQFNSDWAGKTGTSQNVSDEWFVATNPNVTLGLWTGYAEQIEMDYSSASDRTQDLWAQLANAAYDERPKLMAPDQRFHMPSGIVKRKVCKITGKKPSKLCKRADLTRTDLFNEKYTPTKTDDALVKKDGHLTIKKSYIKENFPEAKPKDFYQYLPDDWKKKIKKPKDKN